MPFDRRVVRKLGWAALALALVGAAVHFLPSAGLRYGLTSGLRDLGMSDVALGKARVSLFGGRIALRSLATAAPQGGKADMSHLTVGFSWRSLLDRRISVEQVDLRGLNLELEQRPDGSIIVSGLPIPLPAASAATPADAEPKPWGFGIDALDIADSRLNLAGMGLRLTVIIDRLRLGRLRSWEPDAPATIDLQGSINGAPVSLVGILAPFGPNQTLKLTVTTDGLDLGQLRPLLAGAGLDAAGGAVTLNMALDGAIGAKGTQRMAAQGTLRIASQAANGRTRLTHPQGRLDFAALDWSGAVEASSAGIDLDGTLSATQLDLVLPGERKLAMAELQAELHPLRLSAARRLEWQGEGEAGELQVDLPGIHLTQDGLAWNAKAALDLAGKTPIGDIALRLEGEGLEATQDEPPLVIALEEGNFDATLALLAESPIVTGAKLALSDLTVDGKAGQRDLELLALGKLEAEGLTLDKDGNFAAANLHLRELKAIREIGDTGYPWRVELAQATIADAVLAGSGRLGLRQIDLDALLLRVSRSNTGIAGIADVRNGTGGGANAAPAPRMAVAVGRLDIGGDSRILYEDTSLKRAVRLDAKPVRLSIGPLDSLKPDQDIPVSLSTRFDEFSELAATGSLRPFGPKLSLDLKGSVKNFDLPALSPYAAQALGLNLRTGQFNADVAMKIKEEHLDGKTGLVLSHLVVAAARDKDALSQATGMPVETVLNLLRDGSGDIALSIPIGGDLQDPSFNVNDAIAQAIGGALRDTVATTLKIAFPIASVIEVVLDADNKQRLGLKPIEYAPGSAEIGPDAKAFLETLGKFLATRPDIRLDICGIATARDWPALKQGKPGEPDAALLTDLAARRGRAVKRNLARAGIIAERLFECMPAVRMEAEAVPRVELRL